MVVIMLTINFLKITQFRYSTRVSRDLFKGGIDGGPVRDFFVTWDFLGISTYNPLKPQREP